MVGPCPYTGEDVEKTFAAVVELHSKKEYPYLRKITEEIERKHGKADKKIVLGCLTELERADVVISGNTQIDAGRWVRVYLPTDEGKPLATKFHKKYYQNEGGN